MPQTRLRTDGDLPLSQLRQIDMPSVADQVFDELHANILSLALPPRTRISETEVAKKMGVSRQPVREAFKRLAKLGFLNIRPQSSTTVSLISEEAALRARFIRTALEIQTCRAACENIDDLGIARLATLIEQQKVAVAKNDRQKFHALDEEFHLEICRSSRLDYVWDLICESKGHMDRVRMLSLTETSLEIALNDHTNLFAAISAREAVAAAAVLEQHLGRFVFLIEQMKIQNHNWFMDVSE